MALIDQLYSDGSGSKLDQPIGIQAGRDRQAKERAFKNEEQILKRQERLGRRAYRNAMRSDNPQAQMAVIEAMGSLEDGFMGGIRQSGQTGAAMRGRFESTQQALAAQQGGPRPLQGSQRPAGMSEAEWNQQQAQAPQPGQMIDADGNGVSDMIQRPVNQLLDPVAAVGAVPAQNAPQGPLQRRFGFQSFNAQRAQFGQDLQSSELFKSGDQGAIQRALERGQQLGLSRPQIQSFMDENGLEVPAGMSGSSDSTGLLMSDGVALDPNSELKDRVSKLGDAMRTIDGASAQFNPLPRAFNSTQPVLSAFPSPFAPAQNPQPTQPLPAPLSAPFSPPLRQSVGDGTYLTGPELILNERSRSEKMRKLEEDRKSKSKRFTDGNPTWKGTGFGALMNFLYADNL